MNHPTPEDLERYADGEAADVEQHLQECAACAAAALRIVMMKRAIRDAMREEMPSEELRKRVIRRKSAHPIWWAAAAAVVLALITTMALRTRSQSALPELVDMHVTLLASANPV